MKPMMSGMPMPMKEKKSYGKKKNSGKSGGSKKKSC